MHEEIEALEALEEEAAEEKSKDSEVAIKKIAEEVVNEILAKKFGGQDLSSIAEIIAEAIAKCLIALRPSGRLSVYPVSYTHLTLPTNREV